MPVLPKRKITSATFNKFIAPLLKILTKAPKLLPRGDRPLKMNFDEQLKALIHFHLQEHKSGRHLVEDINTNDFAKKILLRQTVLVRVAFLKS